MNERQWYVVRRLAWTAFAAWIVLSGAFFVYAYTPDPNIPLIKFAAGYSAIGTAPGNVTQAQKEAVEAYVQARNYDVPIWERYTKWMVNYATLQWGYSFTRGKTVTAVIAETAPVTLVYLIPAVILSTLVGISFGVYAATNRGGIADYLGTTTAYVGLGVPNFFLAELIAAMALEKLNWLSVYWDPRYGLWTKTNLLSLTLPAIVLAVNLLAVQARYARAESLEFVPADFVRTLRANGADVRTIARHVFRNASIPLTSVFVAELLTVLFVSIYVIEVVFQVPGLGRMAYQAIQNRDIGLILATTFIPMFVGLFGNLCQDLAYAVLDPRIGSGDGE